MKVRRYLWRASTKWREQPSLSCVRDGGGQAGSNHSFLMLWFLGSWYGRLHERDWPSFWGNSNLQSQFCFT
ncbi:hypothetical protein CGRA01v4_09085 [Colletotrichum graminicola]|nr:hypothetical protein CGRA01v4_09085 [Colletotrichum graminicola]